MAKDTHGVDGEKWIGFDLDGTLAEYNGWSGVENIGKPVKPMCDIIKKLHSEGIKVKIVTARVAPKDVREGEQQADKAREYIKEWCKDNLGFVPEITHEKDALMEKMYDDRAVQVIPNEGIPIEDAALHIYQGKKSDIARSLIDYLTDES